MPIFERVVELAPNEPQSHRDLGLALAEAGQAQAAVDRLYEVVTGAWDARFADIDLIALAELNGVVDKARRDGKAIDVSRIDARLLKNLPLDVRVVLAWDADNTDVDLHVIDPNGEEVFFGHNASYQGGAITRDATGGYGPEEFALRLAKPGKYRVEANFYGHRQQVLTSGTGLMLWLSSGFGTAAQQDRRTTIRVKSERGERDRRRRVRSRRQAVAGAALRRRARRAGSARVGRALGLRRELRRDRLDLVLAHVVVHVAPAGEDGGAIGLLVDREAVLDGAAGVAAGRADRLAVGVARGGDLLGRFDAEHVAAGEQRGRGGENEGEDGAAHGGSGSDLRYFGAAGGKLRAPPAPRPQPAMASRGANAAPGGGVQPRRNASAAMRRPPARCSSVSASATFAAGDGHGRAVDRDDRSGLAAARHDDAAPAGDGLAADDAARARRRIEGAQAALDRRRRLAPVDRRLGLGDLGGVGDAGLGLRPADQRTVGERAERAHDEVAAERRELGLERAGAAVRRRSRRSRRAASRRCRGRRPSA